MSEQPYGPHDKCLKTLDDGTRCTRGWFRKAADGYCFAHSQSPLAKQMQKANGSVGKANEVARWAEENLKRVTENRVRPNPVDVPRKIDVTTVEARQEMRACCVKNAINGAWAPDVINVVLKCLDGASKEESTSKGDSPTEDAFIEFQEELDALAAKKRA